MNPLETQVGGSHYKDMKIQPAEFCHANGIPYLEGCAILVPAAQADMRVGQEVGDVKRGCPAVAPDGLHFLCTLDEGHSGPHQAFAGGEKPEQVWEQ